MPLSTGIVRDELPAEKIIVTTHLQTQQCAGTTFTGGYDSDRHQVRYVAEVSTVLAVLVEDA